MTNQMGDVISITDAQGNELVEYEYDEWGKLILTRADNQSNESIANINPIRYRGYYYDTETGYYYLQSRYYDPSICKFINSDIPEIAGMSKGISAGTNLFAYCNNDSVNNVDPAGERAKISKSVAKTRIIAFMKKFVNSLKKYVFSTYIDWKIPKNKINTVINNLDSMVSVLTIIAGVSGVISAVTAIIAALTGGSTSIISGAAGVLCGAATVASGYVSLLKTRINAHKKGRNLTVRLYTKGIKKGTFKIYER